MWQEWRQERYCGDECHNEFGNVGLNENGSDDAIHTVNDVGNTDGISVGSIDSSTAWCV